jgi:hypothetical protein
MFVVKDGGSKRSSEDKERHAQELAGRGPGVRSQGRAAPSESTFGTRPEAVHAPIRDPEPITSMRRSPETVITPTQEAEFNARVAKNTAEIKAGGLPAHTDIPRKVGNTAITEEGVRGINDSIKAKGKDPATLSLKEWDAEARQILDARRQRIGKAGMGVMNKEAIRRAELEGENPAKAWEIVPSNDILDMKKAGAILRENIGEYSKDWSQGKIDVFQQYAGKEFTGGNRPQRKLAEAAAQREYSQLETIRRANPRMTQLLDIEDLEGFAYEELIKALDNAKDLDGTPMNWDNFKNMADSDKKRISAYLKVSVEGGLKKRRAQAMSSELGVTVNEAQRMIAAHEKLPGSSSSFQDIPKGLRDAEGTQADLPSLGQTFGAEDVIGFREQKATKRMESLLSDADVQMKEIFKDSPENLAIYRDLVSPEAYGGGASPKPTKTAKAVGEELGMTKQTVTNRRKRIEKKFKEVVSDPALASLHPEASSVLKRRAQTTGKSKVKAEDVSIARTTKGNYRVFSGDVPAGTYKTKEQAVRAKARLVGAPGKVTVSKTNKGNYRVFHGDESVGTFGSKLHADQAAVGLQRTDKVRRTVHKAATDALREIAELARGQGRGAGRFEATDFWKSYKLPKDKGTFRGRVLKKVQIENNKLKAIGEPAGKSGRKFEHLWANMLEQYLKKNQDKPIAIPQTVNMVDEFKSQQQGGFGSRGVTRVRRMTPRQFFQRFGKEDFISKLDEILKVDSSLTGGK